ncbi:hypothetical protein B0H10DRAFT_565778 [Mycena sp. CBHHK59/15]|nr:hypothetical protein B0H10DRAFT_565778 [Mycena sp. CBHHK59/15]
MWPACDISSSLRGRSQDQALQLHHCRHHRSPCPPCAHLSQRDPSYHAHPRDLARVPAKADWRYLVEREHQPGPVHVAFRGKTIAFTVGVHILVLRFGLEASMRIITLQDFNEIVSNCVPGPNKNRAKANRLRSFPLPRHSASLSLDLRRRTAISISSQQSSWATMSLFSRISPASCVCTLSVGLAFSHGTKSNRDPCCGQIDSGGSFRAALTGYVSGLWRGPGTLGVGDEPTGLAAGWEEAERTQ